MSTHPTASGWLARSGRPGLAAVQMGFVGVEGEAVRIADAVGNDRRGAVGVDTDDVPVVEAADEGPHVVILLRRAAHPDRTAGVDNRVVRVGERATVGVEVKLVDAAAVGIDDA